MLVLGALMDKNNLEHCNILNLYFKNYNYRKYHIYRNSEDQCLL